MDRRHVDSASGFSRCISKIVISVVTQMNLVFKEYLHNELRDLEHRLDARFECIDGDLRLNRWMLGFLMASVMSIVIKTFFS